MMYYNNKNDNDNNSENSFNKEGRILDPKFLALKRMAEAPTLDESYTIDPKGNRVYFNKTAQARRDFYVNTATPLKADAVRRYEDSLIRNANQNHNNNISSIQNNTVTSASKPNAVRDHDQLFSVPISLYICYINNE